MVGQLEYGRGKAEQRQLYGLPVVCARAEPEGWLGERRLRRAGQTLRRNGAVKVLVPEGFAHWELLAGAGLHPIATGPFLRAQSAALALGVLERKGRAPDRATIALRGERADRELLRAAVALCPLVRNLVIDAPRGGAELAAHLRAEFGVPILPPGEAGEVGLAFGENGLVQDETALHLCGPCPTLEGVEVQAPALAERDRKNLPLLAILWENGRLSPEWIKIT